MKLPVFIPDATLGVVRNLSPQDLKRVGLEGLMVNTYHLIERPGEKVLNQAGGLKKLMNWDGFIASDSGGFQIFSLIQKNPALGKITDDGVVLYTGPKKQKKMLFTPEDSIRTQFAIGSDLMITLDDFSQPEANDARLEQSVKRTIAWAKRAKIEFEKQVAAKNLPADKRPQLLAPIQGHDQEKWRKYCADALLEIGFDLYGLGGWPLKSDGSFDYSMCQMNAQLTPAKFKRFALGVGSPENIVRLFLLGYDIFDCVLPTRDARHQRLYVFKTDPKNLDRNTLEKLSQENKLDQVFDYLYINKGKYETDFSPLSPNCDCPSCLEEKISRAYLRHLFKIGDGSAFRLATLHNLRHYTQLIEILRR